MGQPRVRNAKPCEYNGIKFKSTLEKMVYKTLTDNGIDAVYECKTFEVFPKYKPTVTFYTKNRFKRPNKHMQVCSDANIKDMRPMDNISYTPDFEFEYDGTHVIVEAKGNPTEAYKYRFKLFRAYMETLEDKDRYEIWEIFTKGQLLNCITLLKQKHD